MDTLTCNVCGEETNQIARDVDGHYRGVYHRCRTRGCSQYGQTVAVTPPTLCDHDETKETPSSPMTLSYLYCAACGRLKREWGKGYERTTPPWGY